MEAKELRIGNLVMVNNPESHPKLKDIVLEVTSIHESGNREGYTHGVGLKHINQIPNRYYETYSQFIRFVEPIPLTEECLLKFGFHINYKSEFTHKYSILLDDKIDVTLFPNIEFRYRGQILAEFKYVHQLQNLYFALTGTELKTQ